MKALLLLTTLFWLGTATALPLDGLTDLDGKPALFEHDKNTELVVFWATWCVTCKEKLKGDLPKLNAAKPVAVVAVNTDKDPERVKHFLEKEGITLPVLMDPSKGLRKQLKVFSVPHWAVYKREASGKPWSLVDSAPAFEWDRIDKALGFSRL